MMRLSGPTEAHKAVPGHDIPENKGARAVLGECVNTLGQTIDRNFQLVRGGRFDDSLQPSVFNVCVQGLFVVPWVALLSFCGAVQALRAFAHPVTFHKGFCGPGVGSVVAW